VAASPATTPPASWLRGNYTDVPAAGRAVLHALDLALEDIRKWTEGLSDAEGSPIFKLASAKILAAIPPVLFIPGTDAKPDSVAPKDRM